MKIGLVRKGYSATGGAERYLQRLAGQLQKQGHEPVLFAGMEWPAAGAFPGPLHHVEGPSPLAFARELEKSRRRFPVDYLYSLERLTACDAYRAGDGVHRSWLDRRRKIEAPWKSLFRSWQPKHRQVLQLEEAMMHHLGAGCIVANSRLVAREIHEYYGYPVDRLQVVYNGLCEEATQPPPPGARDAIRQRLGLSGDDRLALFLGTGWERKGLGQAIDAVISAGPPWSLAVVGRGRRPRRSGHDRILFAGPTSDPKPWFAAADLFLLPTWYDPFSNACLEALAAGLPVVTTAANGFSEIMAPGVDGTVAATAADLEGLTRALHEWQAPGPEQAGRTERIAKAARFTIERNARETLEILIPR